MARSHTWREHIDGLRAVSVLAVLFHHIDLPLVTGGYVGVDVFFVISGFLISRVIYEDILRTGSFDIVDFYERRARRILPAFCVVTAAVLVASYFLWLPDEFARLGNSILYACAFAANVYFYLSADYFAPAAETQPLLHYWSLGVEEQFYIVFPLIVIAVAKLGWLRRLGVVVLLIAVGSLALAQFYVTKQPMAAFYLAPHRAWELMAGSLLALPGFPFPKQRIVSELAAGIGIGLIALAVFSYGPQTPFPGNNAIVPVAGAALVLWSCERGSSVVGRVLSFAPLRAIGLWSYSIYMIHWPLIVFGREAWPHGGLQLGVLVAVVSIGLGYVSYRYVETPFRRRSEGRLGIFGASTASLALLAACGASVLVSRGFPARLPEPVRTTLAFNRYDPTQAYRTGVCFLRPEQNWVDLDAKNCLQEAQPTALLWGDSFAAHLFAQLRPLIERYGLTLSQANSALCPPIIGYSSPGRPNCKAFNDDVLAWVVRVKPSIVVLSAAWPIDKSSLHRLDQTIDALKNLGLRVVMIGQSPRYGERVPNILAKRMLRGDRNVLDVDNNNGRDAQADAAMRTRYLKQGVVYVSPPATFCGGHACPLADETGTPLHWDIGHFTRAGAQLAVDRMFSGAAGAAIFGDRLGQVGPQK